VAVLPALQQRTRQQRQPPRLVGDLVDHGVGKARLQPQPGPAGGQLDRAAQLLGAHRADQNVVGSQQAGQAGIGGAVAVVVGPHGNHHGCVPVSRLGSLGQGGEEGDPLGLVPAGGEDLLELIHDQQQAHVSGGRPERRLTSTLARHESDRVSPIGRIATAAVGWYTAAGDRVGDLPHGMFTRADDQLPPAVATGQHALGQGRQQPSPDQRGLPAARRADHADQTSPDEVGDQLGDQPLPAEEELSIAGLETGQPLVGADHRRPAM
jgi:hypothetical protein